MPLYLPSAVDQEVFQDVPNKAALPRPLLEEKVIAQEKSSSDAPGLSAMVVSRYSWTIGDLSN